ncbi:MAG: hypothetical protein SWO11_17740 [Thermodesulfobacteriota bacterium]|nr:hypothetical protein [Thermodesulfobacteriota bacterium]
MNKYFFAAEADKIQDLLFRSSKLREVAGGSVLLEVFCKEAVRELIKKYKEEMDTVEITPVISGGGSFRIIFDSKEAAEEFGEYLSELYRIELGGTITVAEPVEVENEMDAIDKAQEKLRKAKHSGKSPTSVEQIPYMAICASCGVGIAKYHKNLHKDERENYICEICYKKSVARNSIKEMFLLEFSKLVSESSNQEVEFPNDTKEVTKLDLKNNYVAYIVADINNMGMVFSSCNNFEQLEKLSDNLDHVIKESLAEPTKILMEKQMKDTSSLIPVLPLILGGDDIFVLIPARWALDFTQQFVKEFENRMNEFLKNMAIEGATFNHKKDKITISAAVVLCKSKFPYSIAHEIGEEQLIKAKKRAKENDESTISFRLISGNELVKQPEDGSLFSTDFPAYTIEELKSIIEFRLKLNNLPGTVRFKLKGLFTDINKYDSFSESRDSFISKKNNILKRLDRGHLREILEQAFSELGGPEKGDILIFIDDAYYHRLSDLLSVWDYAYDIDKDLNEYLGE